MRIRRGIVQGGVLRVTLMPMVGGLVMVSTMTLAPHTRTISVPAASAATATAVNE